MIMNFLVALLVLFVSSASGLHLEPLCPSSVFSFEDVSVNAFHRLPQNLSFEPLSNYLINRNIICDPNEFQNKSNYMEVLKARNQYNREVAELYSERLLNSPTGVELHKRKSELTSIIGFIFGVSSEEIQVRCLPLFKETIKKGFITLSNLEAFFLGRLPFLDEGVSPSKSEMLPELDKTIGSLQIEEDSETFAFRSLPIDKIYGKHFVLKGKFEFFGEESPQKGRLFYDLLLPFNNRNPPTGRCFEKNELPLFYSIQY